MAKLIFSENVIKEITNISPIVGHEIVVYKKTDGKFKLLEHLSENQTFQEARKTFLERLLRTEMESYVGYAVDMNKYLESTHSDDFIYDDFNTFNLSYSIEYQVIDAARLVSKVVEAGEDALEKLRDIVTKEVKETLLKRFPRGDISDNSMFKEHARSIAEIYSQETLPVDEDLRKIAEVYTTINKKAADVGLQVNKIILSRELSPRERDKEEAEILHQEELKQKEKAATIRQTTLRHEQEANVTIAEYEKEITHLKREQAIIEANHKLQRDVIETNHAEEIKRLKQAAEVTGLSYTATLDDYQRNKQLKQAMVEAAEKALMNVGNNVTSASELRKAADEIRRLVSEQISYSDGGNLLGGASAGNDFSSSGAKFLLPKLNDKSLTELIKIFSEIVELLNNSNVPSDKEKVIMSKVLHLLGELLLGESADEEQLNLYSGEVKKEFSSVMQHLRLERPQQVRDLINLEDLKKRFK